MNRPTKFYIGKDIVWEIQLKDPADSLPVVTVEKLDTDIQDAVTPTADSALIYSCSYSPPSPQEGDAYLVTETVTISGTEYTNTWTTVATFPEAPDDDAVPFTVTVQDDSSNPLVSAMVRVFDDSFMPTAIAGKADSLGVASLSLPPGDYYFLVDQYPRMEPFTAQLVTVADGGSVTLTLSPQEEETGAVGILSGIKRVKTKHMEIESHDPEKMQRVKNAEKGKLPSFCSVHFCEGVHEKDC